MKDTKKTQKNNESSFPIEENNECEGIVVNKDICMICGKEVPEGRIVCYACECEILGD